MKKSVSEALEITRAAHREVEHSDLMYVIHINNLCQLLNGDRTAAALIVIASEIDALFMRVNTIDDSLAAIASDGINVHS
ncbi:hypothetical protein WH7805_13323 [Synechococcus sp. WH 7805]|nr:hypothetical protein WH7805_13323 [Synechococcus sp. WH 7805]